MASVSVHPALSNPEDPQDVSPSKMDPVLPETRIKDGAKKTKLSSLDIFQQSGFRWRI